VDATSAPRRVSPAIEWPTMLVALAIWASWISLVVFHASIPWPLLIVGFAIVTGWYMSLQHEVIHGHPTPWHAVNVALAGLPLYLWLPFTKYRDDHLVHHEVELTIPGVDPESFYVTPEHWQQAGSVRRALIRANRTWVGRMLIGPSLGVPAYVWSSWRRALHDTAERRIWMRHLVAVTAIGVVVFGLAGVPVWVYLIGSTYFGTSVTYTRSFAEHVGAVDPDRRTAVVRSNPVIGLLFLWNNLHITHHALPGAAWYRLPALTTEIDAEQVARANGTYFRGYADVIRRFGVRPFCQPVHPLAERVGAE
jgi:fatty acid desaturase